MVPNKEIKALEEAAAAVRRQFASMIAKAEQVLENRLNEHHRRVTASAARVASLETELETYEALEQDRRAAQVRTELAAAITSHHDEVDGANAALRFAYADYVRAYSSAGIAVEAGFNAAAGAAAHAAGRK